MTYTIPKQVTKWEDDNLDYFDIYYSEESTRFLGNDNEIKIIELDNAEWDFIICQLYAQEHFKKHCFLSVTEKKISKQKHKQNEPLHYKEAL
jgi:hypothetical protein